MREDFVRRLALIRHLYRLGVVQSRLPAPLSAISILIFHDGVELFLQLASEALDAETKSKMEFMDYWGPISKKLPGGELGMNEAMRRLNKARVGFKHAGIRPDKADIEGFRSSVTEFLQENTPKLFDGKKFEEVSMVDLIQFERTRLDLKEAEELIRTKSFKDALTKIATAFAKLTDDYEEKGRKQYGRSPFFFGESFAFQSPDRFGFPDHNIDRYLENVGRTLSEFQEAMKILSLGLDYREYSRFRVYTPPILRIIEGDYVVQWIERPISESESEGLASEEKCRFCLDFVIESAMRLQDTP